MHRLRLDEGHGAGSELIVHYAGVHRANSDVPGMRGDMKMVAESLAETSEILGKDLAELLTKYTGLYDANERAVAES